MTGPSTTIARVALFLVPLLVAIASCSDSVSSPDGNLPGFPDANVSYSQHVQPLFQLRCALPGCHAGSFPEAGLNLSTPSYSNLMNHVPRLVVAGAGDNSLLIQRLDGRIRPQMPLNREPLTMKQVEGIKRWINEGALNN
jgi:hypothetical protein